MRVWRHFITTIAWVSAAIRKSASFSNAVAVVKHAKSKRPYAEAGNVPPELFPRVDADSIFQPAVDDSSYSAPHSKTRGSRGGVLGKRPEDGVFKRFQAGVAPHPEGRSLATAPEVRPK